MDLILKLHKEGKTNKEIVNHLKDYKIKRRNKNDDYSVKDIWVCIDKMKKRVDRGKKVKYSLGNWNLNLDLSVYLKGS